MRIPICDRVPHDCDMWTYFDDRYSRPVIVIPKDLHTFSGEKLYNFIIYYYGTFRRQEHFDNVFTYQSQPYVHLSDIYSRYMNEWNCLYRTDITSSPDTSLRTLEPVSIEQFIGVVGVDATYATETHLQ